MRSKKEEEEVDVKQLSEEGVGPADGSVERTPCGGVSLSLLVLVFQFCAYRQQFCRVLEFVCTLPLHMFFIVKEELMMVNLHSHSSDDDHQSNEQWSDEKAVRRERVKGGGIGAIWRAAEGRRSTNCTCRLMTSQYYNISSLCTWFLWASMKMMQTVSLLWWYKVETQTPASKKTNTRRVLMNHMHMN